MAKESHRCESPLSIGGEHLLRDGNVFRRAAGCAGRKGKVRHEVRPGCSFNTRKGGLPIVAPKVFVGANGHYLLKVMNRLNSIESMVAAEASIAGSLEEVEEDSALRVGHTQSVQLFGPAM